MDNYDEEHIRYDGAERRRMMCAETALLDQLYQLIEKNNNNNQNKFFNSSNIFTIVFSLTSAAIVFMMTMDGKTSKLDYRVETLEKNYTEFKDDMKQIHKQLESIDSTLEHYANKANKPSL